MNTTVTGPSAVDPDVAASGPGLFDPLDIRTVRLPNRIVVSPMQQYSAGADGLAQPWHLVHLASRAVGGAGLVFTGATSVSAVGRISDGDLGLWSDGHIPALATIADTIASLGSVPGLQLAHAGRKGGRTIPWLGYEPIDPDEWGGRLLAPGAEPFKPEWDAPVAMTDAHIHQVIEEFAAAAERAVRAGFRVLDLHFGHGYLAHQFLSPLTNHRTDEYGGDEAARRRFPVEVASAVRAAIPAAIPLFARLSVVDWAPGGIAVEDSVRTAAALHAAGVDLIDCSSGAAVPGERAPVAPLYQVPFARAIREGAAMMTGAVGKITTAAEADGIVRSGDADLVLIGRAMLRDAYWARAAAEALGAENTVTIPLPYRRAVLGMGQARPW